MNPGPPREHGEQADAVNLSPLPPSPDGRGGLRGEVKTEPGPFLGNGVCEPLSSSVPWRTSRPASYELKFLLHHARAEEVKAWAKQHLPLDPHADASLGDAYRIRSVYFDTARLDVFHQAPCYKRRKFRLRRYGSEAGIYLERKSKSGDRVSKRRTLIGALELGRLKAEEPEPAWATSWPGYWFQRRLLVRQLLPRCLVGYERVAHVGVIDHVPMRLTLDRNIRCALVDDLDFEKLGIGIPLLTDQVVLELKFHSALPALFKGLLQEFQLNPTAVSKYRLGIQAWGLDGMSGVASAP